MLVKAKGFTPKLRKAAPLASSWEQAYNLYRKGYQVLRVIADDIFPAKLPASMVAKLHEVYPEN